MESFVQYDPGMGRFQSQCKVGGGGRRDRPPKPCSVCGVNEGVIVSFGFWYCNDCWNPNG